MFANIPKHIISAVGPAYSTRPDVTIASLFGTTPCTLNAKLNNVPKSFNVLSARMMNLLIILRILRLF